jgi:hypothetical protein
MRRSKALGIITEIVSEVTYERLAEDRAERILAALEAAGMEPPTYPVGEEAYFAVGHGWEDEE